MGERRAARGREPRGAQGGMQMLGVGAGLGAAVLALLALLQAGAAKSSASALDSRVTSNASKLRDLPAAAAPSVAEDGVRDLSRSVAGVRSDLSKLRAELDGLKLRYPSREVSGTMDEVMDLVRRLSTELAEIRTLADATAREIEAVRKEVASASATAPVPPPTGGSAEEVERLRETVASLEERLSNLAEREPAGGATPQIDEAALRRAIEAAVEEEVRSIWRDMRDRRRR